MFEDVDVLPQVDDPPPEPNVDQPHELQSDESAPPPIGPRPETPPPPVKPVHPPAFIPEPQQRRAIHRQAITRRARVARANGGLDSVKWTDDVLNEEDTPNAQSGSGAG